MQQHALQGMCPLDPCYKLWSSCRDRFESQLVIASFPGYVFQLGGGGKTESGCACAGFSEEPHFVHVHDTKHHSFDYVYVWLLEFERHTYKAEQHACYYFGKHTRRQWHPGSVFFPSPLKKNWAWVRTRLRWCSKTFFPNSYFFSWTGWTKPLSLMLNLENTILQCWEAYAVLRSICSVETKIWYAVGVRIGCYYYTVVEQVECQDKDKVGVQRWEESRARAIITPRSACAARGKVIGCGEKISNTVLFSSNTHFWMIAEDFLHNLILANSLNATSDCLRGFHKLNNWLHPSIKLCTVLTVKVTANALCAPEKLLETDENVV